MNSETSKLIKFTKLSSLALDEIRNLSIEELIGRMDAVRHAAWKDKNRKFPTIITNTVSPFRSVTDFLVTKRAQELDEKTRRQLAYLVFQYLFQHDLISSSSAISNTVVFPLPYEEDMWSYPWQWTKYSTIEQYKIISSRILLEIFFDLIHFVLEKKRMDGNSKFKSFRKWVVKPDNPFQCFVPDIIDAYKYDRVHRQREIHGTTRFVNDVLRLEVPSQTERSTSYPLTTIVEKLYRALLEIMDYKSPVRKNPLGITISDGTDSVIEQFRNDDEFFIQEMSKFAKDHKLEPLPSMVLKKVSEMSFEEKQKIVQLNFVTKLIQAMQTHRNTP